MADGMRLWGVRAELPREVPLALAAPAFYWSCPARGVRLLALGEAARREARAGGAPGLVRALSETGVEWLDGAGSRSAAGQAVTSAQEMMPGPWLGASAFDPAQPLGEAWRGFAPARFLLPELLCWSAQGRHFAAAFALTPDRAALEARLAWLRERLEERRRPALPELPALLARGGPQGEAAERAAWDALVGAALGEIRAGRLSKVVVARALEVQAAGPLDARPVLRALEERHPTCRVFAVRGDGGAVFLGATPELLCAVDGRTLHTEALAGTARAGEASRLLDNGKDLREHRWVVEHLRARLAPLCEPLAPVPPAPRIRALAELVHLHTPIEARLRAGVTAGEVLGALHPTPAVAGVPTEAALHFLAAHEPFARGLYAGLVGWVGAGRAELAVALRSALLRGPRATLFAGAGIVEGSRAEEEWRETELKAAAVRAALGSGAANPAAAAGARR